MKNTFAHRVIEFNRSLSLDGKNLPDGIRAMNPFRDGDADNTNRIMEEFYSKFYYDDKKRYAIMGINPGRFGAGATGIPFTDTKRLESECGIDPGELNSHETSSVFVYDVINAYGGVDKFYSDFFISSLCPLGFVKMNDKGREVNYNFYDDRRLTETVEPFIIRTLRQQIDIGLRTDKLFLLGSGKNYKYFKVLNEKHHFFDDIVPLEHPRFIMQYRLKRKDEFIGKYLRLLRQK